MAKATDAAPAGVKKIDDDSDDPKKAEADAAQGKGTPLASSTATTEAKAPKKGQFTSDRTFVEESTSLPVNAEETDKMTASKAAEGLKGVKGDDIIGLAVRGLGKDKRLVVVTSAGRKLARKL